MKRLDHYLVLVRHGESLANRMLAEEGDGIYYSRAGSDASVGLTDAGMHQARAVGRRLNRLFPATRPIKRVFENRFARVRDTAGLILEELAYTPARCQDRRIEKRSYGLFWNLTYRGVQELHPDEYKRFIAEGSIDYRPPEGENYHDLFARVEDFIANELGPFEGNQLVVTSSAVVLAFRKALAGLSPQEVVRQYDQAALANGHMDIYAREGVRGEWRLKARKAKAA